MSYLVEDISFQISSKEAQDETNRSEVEIWGEFAALQYGHNENMYLYTVR